MVSAVDKKESGVGKRDGSLAGYRTNNVVKVGHVEMISLEQNLKEAGEFTEWDLWGKSLPEYGDT